MSKTLAPCPDLVNPRAPMVIAIKVTARADSDWSKNPVAITKVVAKTEAENHYQKYYFCAKDILITIMTKTYRAPDMVYIYV